MARRKRRRSQTPCASAVGGPSNRALKVSTYGSSVSTKSQSFTRSTWPSQTRSYRESHLGPGKGKSYDEDLRDRTAAKGLEWLVEQQLLASILDRMSASSEWSFADFACGTGRILEFISAKIPTAVGIDISPEMLGLARARCPWATLIQGDVTADPALAPGPFDLITAFRFFLNAEPTLRSQVLTWMRMALRQGGWVVANFHRNPASLRGTYLRARTSRATRPAMMSVSEACEMLKVHGFTPRQVVGYSFLPYRRDGRKQLAPSVRRAVETRLAGNRALLPAAGSFIVVSSLD